MAKQLITPECQYSEIWQQTILDSADFTIISTDCQGIIQTLNAGALRKLGYEPDEVIGKVTPTIFLDPNEITQRSQQLSQELGYPIEPNFEVLIAKARLNIMDENIWTCIGKNNSRFLVRISMSAHHDEAGTLTSFLGIGQDITEQQKIEQSLRESEARYRSLYEHTPVMLHSIDQTGQLISVSDTWLSLMGYERSEVLGRPSIDFLSASSQEYATTEVLPQYFQTGVCQDISYQFVKKNGEILEVLLSAIAERDNNGEILRTLAVSIDVTERKRIETALFEREQIIRLAFDNAPIGKVLIAVDGHFLKVNRSICEIVGYSEAELLALTLEEITHPDDIALDQSYLEKLLVGEIDTYQIEKRYIHQQGHEVWILLNVSLVKQSNNQPSYFIAQIQDISQRKKADMALQQSNIDLEQLVHKRTIQLENADYKLQVSEANYQDLYENAPDMYISVDTHTSRILQCNQTLCNALGLSKNEILNRPILDVYHPDCHPQVKTAFQTFVTTGKVQDAQLQLQRKDGSKLEVSLNAQAVRDDNGNVLYSRSSWRDITKRKQLEQQLQQINGELEQRVQDRTQALKKSQERLELALQASGDAWWHWNIDREEQEWSPLFGSMLGYEAGELQPRYETWEHLVHPDDLPWVIEKLNAHFQDSSIPYAFDYRVLAKSGEWKWIANLGKVVERDAHGQPMRMAGMHHDISERKQAEAELQQLNRELQRSNEELGQFAYVASHDLQEPLRTVKSFAELLAKRYQGQLDEKADRYIHYITDGAMRMQTLISDLLAYSRAGRFELTLKSTNLEQVVEQVCSDLQTVIQNKNAKVEVQSLPTLCVDPTQMQQLMQNLISNALKYCEADYPSVQIQAVHSQNSWTISIQDNGIGDG